MSECKDQEIPALERSPSRTITSALFGRDHLVGKGCIDLVALPFEDALNVLKAADQKDAAIHNRDRVSRRLCRIKRYDVSGGVHGHHRKRYEGRPQIRERAELTERCAEGCQSRGTCNPGSQELSSVDTGHL